MSSMRGFSTTGIVLKRTNVGEADRVVTLFTREHGKIIAIAKGARKLTSSKLSALEPGCLSKMYLVRTQSLPLLTQATLMEDFSPGKRDLVRLRKVFEILEMLDTLLPEEDEHMQVFSYIQEILNHIATADSVSSRFVRDRLTSILEELGFIEKEKVSLSTSIRELVEGLTQKELKAYAYLSSG